MTLPFQDVSFRHAISLGANCETAYQLRKNGRHTLRVPFDWLITPPESLVSIIATDGSNLGTSFIVTQQGVRCAAYDVLYAHEFPLTDANLVRFDAATIEGCRAKLLHKWSNVVRVCEDGGPILFVRLCVHTGLPWDRFGPAKERLTSASLDAVAAALARRFPGLDFRLLAIVPDPSESIDLSDTLDPRIAVMHVARGENRWMAISDDSWQAICEGLRFRESPALTPLGETLHLMVPDGQTPDLAKLYPHAAVRLLPRGENEGWAVADEDARLASPDR